MNLALRILLSLTAFLTSSAMMSWSIKKQRKQTQGRFSKAMQKNLDVAIAMIEDMEAVAASWEVPKNQTQALYCFRQVVYRNLTNKAFLRKYGISSEGDDYSRMLKICIRVAEEYTSYYMTSRPQQKVGR